MPEANVAPFAVSTVGVIGAGQMGAGIAQVCAGAGYRVRLQDLSDDRLSQALAGIDSRLERQVGKQQISADDRTRTMEAISTSVAVEAFGDCDMVIEAASENCDVKLKIFEKVCPVLGPDAILCTNTSSISVTMLAAHTDRPERFLGVHFMNPVPVMKLVELIRAITTDDAAYVAARQLVDRLGKTPVLAQDYPAFIVNRVLLPMVNEAVYALHEGVGDVVSIDTAMRLGANHPMGPLQLGDFIGLDTCLAIMRVLYEGTSDSKYRPCPLLVKYVEAGWFGRKAGRGFYDYRQTPPTPNFVGLRPV